MDELFWMSCFNRGSVIVKIATLFCWQEVELKKGRFAHMQTGKVFLAWILMCWPCRQHQIVIQPNGWKTNSNAALCSDGLHFIVIQSMHSRQCSHASTYVGPKGIQPLLEQHNHALAVVYNDHYRHCGLKMMRRWWKTKPNTPWRSSVEYIFSGTSSSPWAQKRLWHNFQITAG